ncbi:hypothetical protein ASF49_08070 [Methylobacterium sp. Leaf104]|uniref:hypothetical protein n=1 Tax=Methylobacterium TaxID=407 RepID=UPI0006F4E298|nr:MULTISPECIES: hypothetical protein [Methylobacterium]KQP33813.1 hypothetical protein ASF49_08070 [Methylobacterium sp. Leaf104]MCI9879619.1 hypothetical protein [Methylobacterium goesingense]
MATPPIPWHTRAKISGVPLAAGAELGIEEAHEDLQQHQVRMTWRGLPKIFGPAHRRVHKVTLSCKDRLPPAWEHLRVRDPVLLQSVRFEGAVIPAGLSSVALRYSPCPEARKPSGFAVIAHRSDTNRRVAFTVAGRVVTLAEPAEVDVLVRYRPILPCQVLSIDPGSATEIEGRQGWGLALVVLA